MGASLHDRVWYLGKLPDHTLCTFGRVAEVITRPLSSDGKQRSPVLRVVVADKTSDAAYETIEDVAERFVLLERAKPVRNKSGFPSRRRS